MCFSVRSPQSQALIFSSISPATSGLARSFPVRYSFMTSSTFSDTSGVTYASPQQLHTRAGTFLITTNYSPAFNIGSVEPSRSWPPQRAHISEFVIIASFYNWLRLRNPSTAILCTLHFPSQKIPYLLLRILSPAFSNTNIQGHRRGRASFQYG
jgi:hypothetical protein